MFASVIAPTSAPAVAPFAMVATTVPAGFSTVMLPVVVSSAVEVTRVMTIGKKRPSVPKTDTAPVPLVTATIDPEATSSIPTLFP